MTAAPTRDRVRQEMRQRRRALGIPEQTRAGQRLAAGLGAIRLLRAGRRIACYLPNDGEIDPVPMMFRLWRMKKVCYLPILSRLTHDRLWFAPFTPDTPLTVNRFGIPEPDVAARLWVRAQELDLVLLPLVAFDSAGNRLGMGGGFYDKSLEFILRRRVWQKPHLIGLAHDFQHVDRLPVNAWDVPLQAVATDRAVYTYK